MKRLLSILLAAPLLIGTASAQTLTPAQQQTVQGAIAQLQSLLAVPPPPSGCTVTVAAGADLQAALNAVQPGCTLLLTSGATWTGDYILPTKTGPVIISASAPPPAGVRVSPTSTGFARIVSPDGGAALATSPGAGGGYTLIGLDVGGDGGGDLILLGDGSSAQNSLALVPGNLIVDRFYAHGSDANGRKRCIALNSASTTIENSYIANCKLAGQDAQAVAGWNGPGPYTLTNNYLEGAGNNFILGGSDPAIPNLVPSDVTITGNTFNKPTTWRGQPWQVKNWLELKNAQRVTVTGNTFMNVWADAQTGYGIVLTVRDQDGACPWCIVQQVTFSDNTLAHMAGVVQILGTDNVHPSLRETGLVITNNTASDVDPLVWNNPRAGMNGAWGAGIGFGISASPSTLEIGHNTVTGGHLKSFIDLSGPGTITTLSVHDNVLPEGDYGIHSDTFTIGWASLAGMASSASFIDNAVIVGSTQDGNPSGRSINYGSQTNYVLPAGTSPSGLTQATTDGKPIGAGQ